MIQFDLTPFSRIWVCCQCRTHLGQQQDCIFVLSSLGNVCFRNISNVVIDGPESYRELWGRTVADVKCGNSDCRHLLGYKYIQEDAAGAIFILYLSSILVWDGNEYRPYQRQWFQNTQQNVSEPGLDHQNYSVNLNKPAQEDPDGSGTANEPGLDHQNYSVNLNEPPQKESNGSSGTVNEPVPNEENIPQKQPELDQDDSELALDEQNREGNVHEVAQDDQNQGENLDEPPQEPAPDKQNREGNVLEVAQDGRNQEENLDEPAQ